jgi:hypothetical protein
MISAATVVLEAQNQVRFTVPYEHARQMGTVVLQLDAHLTDDAVCFLPEISAETLEAVLCFLARDTDTWCFDSLAVHMPVDLLKAANYLDCQPLLSAAAAHIARVCFTKTNAQIQEYYGVQPSYTPAEERRIYASIADMDYSDTN